MKLAGRLGRGIILVCLALQANAGDPVATFDDAKAYAQGTVDGMGGIVSAEKAATLPHYTTHSPVSELTPGSVGLGGAGIGKIQGCVGKTDNECAAVNFLAKNPDSRLRFNLDPATDPSLQAGMQVLVNPSAVVGTEQDGTESVCLIKAVTDPATYTTEVCNEYRTSQQFKCRRGFSANVGTVIDAKSFEVNRGAEVPSWTGRTFDMNFNVQGSPSGFRVVRYQADNYGQLWVNGVKVYDNTMGYYSYDMRYSVNGIFPVANCWFGECYESYAQGLRSSDGTVHQIFDDNCNYGCRGVSPNIDITQYIKEGDNLITLVCINAGGIGPCYINITGTASRLVFLGSLISNGCASLESRSQ